MEVVVFSPRLESEFRTRHRRGGCLVSLLLPYLQGLAYFRLSIFLLTTRMQELQTKGSQRLPMVVGKLRRR